MAVATLDRRRRRVRVGALVVVIGIVAAIVAVVVANPFASTSSGPTGFADNAAPTSLATVKQNTIHSQDPVQGTLGYAGSYSILNETSGAYTRLPSAGAVIKPGQPLYWVDGKPVVLLSGHTPAYRALSEGLTGSDVQQLNADLVALGYATTSEIDPTSDYFSAETAYAVERLQARFDLTETGSLALGSVVFEPGAMRLTTVTPTLGSRAGAGLAVRAGDLDHARGDRVPRRGPAVGGQGRRPGGDHATRQQRHPRRHHQRRQGRERRQQPDCDR